MSEELRDEFGLMRQLRGRLRSSEVDDVMWLLHRRTTFTSFSLSLPIECAITITQLHNAMRKQCACKNAERRSKNLEEGGRFAIDKLSKLRKISIRRLGSGAELFPTCFHASTIMHAYARLHPCATWRET